MSKRFHVRDSTLNCLSQFEYTWTGIFPQVGDMIKLVHFKTKIERYYEVQYIKKIKNGFIVKNSNITLKLIKKQEI
ncbi:MAG: hypothetical protein PVG65_00900 [Candidatus Thorarchaeota archaeon]|jgi:hypothetical protein